MQQCDLIVGEGATELAIAKRILEACGMPYADARFIDKGGRQRFWRDAPKYAAAARNGIFVLGLADLESAPCVGWLLSQHLPHGRPQKFKLRVAVHMAESWLLADHTAVTRWLRVSPKLLPSRPDEDPQAKLTLVNLARHSPIRSLKETLVPAPGHSGLVGREYLRGIRNFIAKHWDPDRAARNSPSLTRALHAIREP